MNSVRCPQRLLTKTQCPEFDSFAGRLRHKWLKVELFCKISSPSYIWPKLSHAAVARSVCDS